MTLLTPLVSLLLSAGPVRTVTVSSQRAFDALDRQVRAALSDKPGTLHVVIEPGTYRFHDDHLDLFRVDCPDTDLIIEGDGATLTGEAPQVRYSPFTRLRRPVEIVDAERKLCRIRAEGQLPGTGQLYVQVTAWYQLFTCPVVEKKGRYLYFVAEKLARSGLGYNINGDFTFAGRMPRYRLMRMDEGGAAPVTAFLKLTACTFRSVSLSGITFDTNTGGRSGYAKDCLVRFYQDRFGEAVVKDCTFRGIRSDVVHVAYSDRVRVSRCTFEDCHRTGVLSDKFSDDTQVVENKFIRMGLSGEYTPCVRCLGSQYLIARNRFEDFGNCAVGVGVHFSEQMGKPASGVVEENEMYQTEPYRRDAPMNLLMDTGAIYVWTQNSSLLIRGNRIHDIDGPAENRGIFCDDGTVNTTIRDNEVVRIANSWCIDLRKALSVEKRADSKIRKVNVGNRMESNTVDGKVRFENR